MINLKLLVFCFVISFNDLIDCRDFTEMFPVALIDNPTTFNEEFDSIHDFDLFFLDVELGVISSALSHVT